MTWVVPVVLQCDSLRRFFIAEKWKEPHGTRSAEQGVCQGHDRFFLQKVPDGESCVRGRCHGVGPPVGEHFWPYTTNPPSQTYQTLETKTSDWQDDQTEQSLGALSLCNQRDKSRVYWLSISTSALSRSGGGRGHFHWTICRFVSGA
jgi:hypothetical protein